MATWQFQCFIISSKKNTDKLSHDEIISWEDVEQPSIYPDFLGRGNSWSTDIIQFGNIDKTCIEFIYDKGKLEEIVCRLDLRTLTKRNLISILEYVQSIEACFLFNDKICFPELETMVSFIKKSKAHQYCKDPLKYFKYLNQSEQ